MGDIGDISDEVRKMKIQLEIDELNLQIEELGLKKKRMSKEIKGIDIEIRKREEDKKPYEKELSKPAGE